MGFSIVGKEQIEPAEALLTKSPPSTGDTLPTPEQPSRFSILQVDETTGAPAGVRNLVGGAPPENRLETLRQFFPDAQPSGADNFVFTNPQSGELTLYNPKGIDVGDVASVTPEIAEGVGGAFGGVLAAPPAVAGAPSTGGLSLVGIPAGVGLGAAAGREVENLIATNLGGRIDRRTLERRLSEAAVTAGVNATGQRLGELVGQGVSLALGQIRKPGQATLEDFVKEGIDAPASAVSGNRTVQVLDRALSDMVPAADIMQRAAQRTIGQLDTAVTDLAGRFGAGSTRAEAGRALQSGGEAFRTRFLATSEGLYNNLSRFVPNDQAAQLPKTMDALQGIAGQFPTNPEFGKTLVDPQFQRWAKLLQDGGGALSFGELRAFRSFIGRRLSQPAVISDIPRAELARLYGAISSDLEGVAAGQGAGALRAFKRADRHYRVGLDRINTVASSLDERVGPENVFRLAIQQPATAGAAKESIKTIRAYRSSVPPERWDTVAGTTLRNLGRAKPGAQDATGEAFSVSTFLTNWNRMSPAARDVLFKGTRYADLSGGLDRLVKIAGSLKATERAANPSGTARNLYAMLLLSSLAGGGAVSMAGGDPGTGLVAGASAILAPRAAAKLITSPGFVRWVAQAPKVNIRNPNSVTAHIGRLAVIAEAEPEIHAEIQQFLGAFSSGLTEAPSQLPQNPLDGQGGQ